MFFKMAFLKISQILQENTCAGDFLDKVAGLQDLLKRDSTTQVFSFEINEIFKNTLMVASDRLRNVFARQIFTIQLKSWSPEQFLKYLPSSQCRQGRQLKSCFNLVYFHFYSFATGMAQMSSNIFISNVLLKNPTERNA